jgi:hypothetical protein
MKYAVGIFACLVCIGASIWGSVTYYPAPGRAVVEPAAPVGVETGVGPEVSAIVADNATTEETPARPAPVTDNYSSPTGRGVVHASFTVVG